MQILPNSLPAQTVRVFDAIKALAFIGDLSMGQPTDQSIRTAWLALQIARECGFDDAECDVVREASLLRWSGCTANADGFAEALGDDIAGREAMLALRPDWAKPLDAHGGASVVMTPLAQIHCEVSGEVARLLGLAPSSQATLRHIFEAWDGSGIPDRLSGSAVPQPVFVVAVAGDLEIFSRLYGVENALTMITRRADARYPARLVHVVSAHAHQWLEQLEQTDAAAVDESLVTTQMEKATTIELIADVIDLKLPWMTGFSRAVAKTASSCAESFALDAETRALIYRAGLIHGIGRAAVPNSLWNAPTQLSSAAWEKLRLVPYWTSRAGRQTGALAESAELASYAYERLDGSGYFRGAAASALSIAARILAASVAWVALRAPRPWRAALTDADAAATIRREASQGRFDSSVVENLVNAESAAQAPQRTISPQSEGGVRLSTRETEILRLISRGSSNKEVARSLELSPSTVRTHVESVFRKLECSTRAAATLKASALGWL
jgi:HD-GYP domain-containing protein (c-di-GMP phosphodiesterase class II)